MSDVTYNTSANQSRVTGFLGGLTRSFGQYRVYRNTLGELQALSNRELADLGLSRSMLRSVAYKAAYKG